MAHAKGEHGVKIRGQYLLDPPLAIDQKYLAILQFQFDRDAMQDRLEALARFRRSLFSTAR